MAVAAALFGQIAARSFAYVCSALESPSCFQSGEYANAFCARGTRVAVLMHYPGEPGNNSAR